MGIHLRRTRDDVEAIDALAQVHGGRVGLEGVLADLRLRARRSYAARVVAPGTEQALTWRPRDRYGIDWYPQGISSSADASDDGLVHGRELLTVSWYSRRGAGSRLTFLDLRTLRYQHVRLVTTDLEPVLVHAGGLVWHGPYVHLAATARGLLTFRLEDVLRVGDELVLPLAFALRAGTDGDIPRMRYSFLSLDRSGDTAGLLAGEYGRRAPNRVVRIPLDPATYLPTTDAAGLSHVEIVDPGGLVQMQGLAVVGDAWFTSTSAGYLTRGSLHAGGPGRLSERILRVPMGPEDLCTWPGRRQIWSLSEHPWGRWVYAIGTDTGK